MEILKGIGVSPGVVISTAVVLDDEDVLIPERRIAPSTVGAEMDRFYTALAGSLFDLQALRDETEAKAGKELAGIFDFHQAMLRDKNVINQITQEIRLRFATAEYASTLAMRGLAAKFSGMTDRYLSERVKDIHDIERRLLRNLIGLKHSELGTIKQPMVVIAHDLLPSQTAALDKNYVKGFATDVGGRTSHTAIVARAMGIPAVVGLGNVTASVAGGDTIIIDGTRGVVIVNPNAEQLAEHREYERRQIHHEADLEQISGLAATTLDGSMINLLANIEFPAEIDDAVHRGASGIGLYRTEFLYLSAGHEPSEEDHYLAYADALRRLDGKPLVIRTLDLGADKYISGSGAGYSNEKNPFLGDRSIRLCLHNIPMFKRQLRAILRASLLGEIRVMFPMISTLMELRQAKMVWNDVMEELEDEGIEHKKKIAIGMMVEVPAVVYMANNFAKEVDFFSIGTNDLIQYTLAVDRTNERVAGLYNPAHPAVLAQIRDVIRAGNRNNIGVSVCGEMAGEPQYTLLLLGLGLTHFSMNGPDIPEVKKIIRSTTMDHARQVARRVLSFDSERQVMHFLREETRRLIPEAF